MLVDPAGLPLRAAPPPSPEHATDDDNAVAEVVAVRDNLRAMERGLVLAQQGGHTDARLPLPRAIAFTAVVVAALDQFIERRMPFDDNGVKEVLPHSRAGSLEDAVAALIATDAAGIAAEEARARRGDLVVVHGDAIDALGTRAEDAQRHLQRARGGA